MATASLTPPLPREIQLEVTGAGNLSCEPCLHAEPFGAIWHGEAPPRVCEGCSHFHRLF